MFFRLVSAAFRMPAIAGVLLFLPTQSLDAKPLPGELAGKERAVRLEPASPWHLEFADDRCRLARRFDSPNGPGMVLFEQLAPGSRFDLTIAGPDFASSRQGSWFYGGMRSDLEMETISPLEYDIPGYENAITLGGVRIDDAISSPNGEGRSIIAAIDPASAGLVDRIVLQRSTTIVSFETGNMKAPFEALNACSQDLVLEWGLDANVHRAYRPPQMPDEKVYFTRLHHKLTTTPGNEGHKSLLRVRAIVASDGSVTDCHHEFALSSGGAEPDVCRDILEMQFEPATAPDGEPVASFYTLSLILSQFDPWTADAHGGRWGSGS